MTARVAPSAASWRMLCRRTASMELRSLSWSSDWARLSPLLYAHSNRLGRYSFALPYMVAGGGRRSLGNLTIPILNRTFRPDVPKTPGSEGTPYHGPYRSFNGAAAGTTN